MDEKHQQTNECGAMLRVAVFLNGPQLEPKVCTLPAGHQGPHTNGSAVWMNTAERPGYPANLAP